MKQFPRSLFRCSVTNQRLTKSLFYELTGADKSTVVYTLKDVDHTVLDKDTGEEKTYPSLYQLYMEVDDPTEWEVAQNLADGWDHWQLLCSCSWFKPYVERWRKEQELRMKSKALARIKSEAKTGSKESFGANKYLLEKGWEPKEGSRNGRGRPSKEEIKKAADEILRNGNQLSEDFKRLGLQ